eukprot:SAG31_NODE_4648_length_3069_cov_1.952525_2_plen_340_part_00
MYNETYLDELENIVDLAAAHGVYVFLDMHQDGLSELFCGEGFPRYILLISAHPFFVFLGGGGPVTQLGRNLACERNLSIRELDIPAGFLSWAIRRQPVHLRFPFPFSPPFNNSQMYDEPTGELGRIPRHEACSADHGPDYGQWTREAAGAYQAIYSNWDGLGDAFASAWAHVAHRFAHRSEILGLELMNEPFAGDFYNNKTNETNWMQSPLMIPYPNPLNADRKNLQPLFDRVNAAVRAVDDEVLLFFAGIIWDDQGAGFSAPPGGPAYANRSVLSYHYYNPPQTTVGLQFDSFNKSARRLKVMQLAYDAACLCDGRAALSICPFHAILCSYQVPDDVF